MSEEIIISVILPVHNGGRFLDAAIESIVDQSEPRFELLIFNDGSSDNSSAIIDRWSCIDSRIKVFSGPNRGLLRVLQDGVDRARGVYIARMDADDIAVTDRFSKQLSFLSDNPDVVAVGSSVLLMDPDGEVIGLKTVSTSHSQIDHELLNDLPGKIGHPTVMMRTGAVRQVGGYQRDYHLEDVDLFLRLAEVGKLANMEEPLLRYRLHSSSICHTRKQSQINQIYHEIVSQARMRRGLPVAETAFAKDEVKTQVEGKGNDHIANESTNSCAWSAMALHAGFRRVAWKHACRAVRANVRSRQSWWAISCCVFGRKWTDRLIKYLPKKKRFKSRVANSDASVEQKNAELVR